MHTTIIDETIDSLETEVDELIAAIQGKLSVISDSLYSNKDAAKFNLVADGITGSLYNLKKAISQTKLAAKRINSL